MTTEPPTLERLAAAIQRDRALREFVRDTYLGSPMDALPDVGLLFVQLAILYGVTEAQAHEMVNIGYSATYKSTNARRETVLRTVGRTLTR